MNNSSTLQDAERFIACEYIDGAFDCGDLVVLVQRELFARLLDVPLAAARSAGVRGQARDLAVHLARYTRRTTAPATGDLVLFWETTPNGIPPLNRRWHLGTVFLHLGAPWVLHCQNETFGTRLQPLHEVLAGPLHLESFLQWI